VNNVLVRSTGDKRSSKSSAPVANSSPRADGPAVLVDDNRVSLPARALALLGVRPGEMIPWRSGLDGEVILMSPHASQRFIHETAAKYVERNPGSWSDALLEERRKEARREDEKDSNG
jgi:hypothetical protein